MNTHPSSSPAAGTEGALAAEPATALVWDPAVRLFHWTLVFLFAVSFLTEDLQALHQGAGYAVLALVAFRVVWGFLGPRYARFADFVRPPSAALAYVRGLLAGRAERFLGHNPAGGLMIVALLVMVTAAGVSGWMLTLDAFRHAGWAEEVHESLAWTALALAAVHVLGVAASSAAHGENLVMAMITGRKRA